MEQLIEERLIRGVVERFNRETKTQRCRHLSDTSEIDIETIDSAMGKCSTYMFGHDMLLEASGAFPNCEEIEQDERDNIELFARGGYGSTRAPVSSIVAAMTNNLRNAQ
ncbi:TPA: hypothetical protein ACGSUT_000792 [Vibrio parahaemolyticus]